MNILVTASLISTTNIIETNKQTGFLSRVEYFGRQGCNEQR